jgi:hypothetical protein
MFDPTKFVSELHEYIGRVMAPIVERLKALELRPVPDMPMIPAKGEKGDPGEPGRDAVVSYDDIVKAVEEVHERIVPKYILDLERRGTDAIQRAIDRLPVPKDGKDGIDALGFDDLESDYDGDRTLTLRFVRGAQKKEFTYRLPLVIDRGYHRKLNKYEKGDAVTHDGTLWIALKSTDLTPSIAAKQDWRIAARKGEDGRPGVDGIDAPSVVALRGR